MSSSPQADWYRSRKRSNKVMIRSYTTLVKRAYAWRRRRPSPRLSHSRRHAFSSSTRVRAIALSPSPSWQSVAIDRLVVAALIASAQTNWSVRTPGETPGGRGIAESGRVIPRKDAFARSTVGYNSSIRRWISRLRSYSAAVNSDSSGSSGVTKLPRILSGRGHSPRLRNLSCRAGLPHELRAHEVLVRVAGPHLLRELITTENPTPSTREPASAPLWQCRGTAQSGDQVCRVGPRPSVFRRMFLQRLWIDLKNDPRGVGMDDRAHPVEGAVSEVDLHSWLIGAFLRFRCDVFRQPRPKVFLVDHIILTSALRDRQRVSKRVPHASYSTHFTLSVVDASRSSCHNNDADHSTIRAYANRRTEPFNLSPVRLPVSPLRRSGESVVYADSQGALANPDLAFEHREHERDIDQRQR